MHCNESQQVSCNVWVIQRILGYSITTTNQHTDVNAKNTQSMNTCWNMHCTENEKCGWMPCKESCCKYKFTSSQNVSTFILCIQLNAPENACKINKRAADKSQIPAYDTKESDFYSGIVWFTGEAVFSLRIRYASCQLYPKLLSSYQK